VRLGEEIESIRMKREEWRRNFGCGRKIREREGGCRWWDSL
jgi:hypothetical protein